MKSAPTIANLLVLSLLGLSACGGGENKKTEDSQEPFPKSMSRENETLPANVVPVAVAPIIAVDDFDTVTDATPAPKEIEPANFSGFMRRGRERFRSEDLSGALSDYQAAAAKAPHAQMPNIQIARTYLKMGEASSARDSAEQAIEIDASSSLAWNTLGRVELSEADYDAAVVSFSRAVEENEDNSYAWNNLGYAYIELKDFAMAVDALEHATSGASPTGYMWNNLGMAYEHLDQIIEARASYRLAAEEGSGKAQLNFDRLEGVVSLIAGGEGEEIAQMDAEEMEFELPLETSEE